MPCSGRYAEAIDYSVLFRCSGIYAGFDNSIAGVGNLFLTDTTVNFVDMGVAVGNPVLNSTTGTYGTVSVVTQTVLTTTNTWSTGDAYRLALLSPSEVATIEMYLELAAPAIHAAMAANGMCDCTLASWAPGFLAQLNNIIAAALHNCPCARGELSDELRQSYLDLISDQLTQIRTGQLELCQGETGSDFPAMGISEPGWNSAVDAMNIRNAEKRDS